MADNEELQKTFVFEEGSHIIANVESNRSQAATRFCFLAKNYIKDSLKLIVIKHERSFERSPGVTGTKKWSAQSFNLSLQANIGEIKKAFLVESDSKESELRDEKI